MPPSLCGTGRPIGRLSTGGQPISERPPEAPAAKAARIPQFWEGTPRPIGRASASKGAFMVRRYTFGNPIETEAVLDKPAAASSEPSSFTVDEAQKRLVFKMKKNDAVIGLGGTVGGIDKRGGRYVSWCSDDPDHVEDKASLYAAQNFFILDRAGDRRGYFIDAAGRVTFDVGFTEPSELVISFDYFDADVYEIEGETKLEIVRAFRKMIGRSYIPPKWAFGLGQSRWGYSKESEFAEIADRYEAAGIPLDMIYLDIDYMERFKDFTVNGESFPDLARFAADMKARGIRLVPIIDAGVKIEDGYDVYEEGKEGGYFCKDEDGGDFTAAVWPGAVHFPDFLDKDAREWFGSKYKVLLDMGIEGFWNDMNEPALFYSPKHLGEVFEKLKEYEGKNLGIYEYFSFMDLMRSVSNYQGDYESFYHKIGGEMVRHDRVHNLYGYNMTRAAGEGIRKERPDSRYLLFSRASYVGMHRYGGIWSGDNKSWWSHILLNLRQLPAYNMCGFLYSGADTGGFGCNCSRELLLRWLGVSLFTPLFRNHAALGTRKQEFDAFGDPAPFAKLVKLRYSLIPYLYSEFMKAALNDGMYFLPLSFVYENDARAAKTEDQLLVGESIMIAPVYTPNALGRFVYLPEDMLLLRFRSFDDYDEVPLAAGDHFVEASPEEVLVFLRKGHVLPLAAPATNTGLLDYGTITYITNGADPASYELYDDDGTTPAAQ